LCITYYLYSVRKAGSGYIIAKQKFGQKSWAFSVVASWDPGVLFYFNLVKNKKIAHATTIAKLKKKHGIGILRI
jgi:hypothetical protein